MEFYNKTITISDNNKTICRIYDTFFDENGKESWKNHRIDWDELDDFYKKYALELPFYIEKNKKGLVIRFYDSFKSKKQWKWESCYSYSPYSVEEEITVNSNWTINDILKHHDGENAIKFLVERGLTILPKKED